MTLCKLISERNDIPSQTKKLNYYIMVIPVYCASALEQWLDPDGECCIIEPRHEISNNVVCATSKASDQPAHTRSLIRTFASSLNII